MYSYVMKFAAKIFNALAGEHIRAFLDKSSVWEAKVFYWPELSTCPVL